MHLEDFFDGSHELGSDAISRYHGNLEGAVGARWGGLGDIATGGETEGPGARGLPQGSTRTLQQNTIPITFIAWSKVDPLMTGIVT